MTSSAIVNATSPHANDTTVSLVLGSGGARGYAHIGVIEALLARGYRIEAIAGSSMGALVGGIYAAGELDAYKNWVQALERYDIVQLVDLSMRGPGLIKGERIIGVLRELVGEFEIESLPIAYTAVATDLDSGKEVWLRTGPLFDAIRASIAVPSLFLPHTLNGRRLIDGGVVNPVPIAPTLASQAGIIVAVDVNGPPEDPPNRAQVAQVTPDKDSEESQAGYHARIQSFITDIQAKFTSTEDEAPSIVDVVTRSLEIMQGNVARLKLAAYAPDVQIVIPSNVAPFFDFHRADELIEVGRRCANEVLDRHDAQARSPRS